MCNSTANLHAITEEVTSSRSEALAPPTEVKAAISLLQRLQRLLVARLLSSQADQSGSSTAATVSQNNQCEFCYYDNFDVGRFPQDV